MRTWFGSIATATVTAIVIAYSVHAFGPRSAPSPAPQAAAPTTSAGAPLTVAVTYGSGTTCGSGLHWAFPSATDLPPGSTMQTPADLTRFAAAHQGVPTRGFEITLTVQAPTSASVVLTGMHAIVLARRPAVPGVYMETDGCGGVSPRWFSTSTLDTDPVSLTAQNGEDSTGATLPAVTFPYQVSETDPEYFVIAPSALNDDVDWYLELDWVAAGKSGTTVVDDSGKPFRFTGTSAAEGYSETSNGGWQADGS